MTYVRAAILLAFAALVAAVFWYRASAVQSAAERDMARAELRVAVDANRASQETIAKLREEAEANDRLLSDMAAQIALIDTKISETNSALSDLRDTNEDVRSYLDSLVPADVDELLNR